MKISFLLKMSTGLPAVLLFSLMLLLSGCESSTEPDPLDELVLPIHRGGVLASGALWETYIPENWNRNLIMIAPGYSSPYGDHQLSGIDFLSEYLEVLGYGWATTGYHKNGLVLPQAVEDIGSIVKNVRVLTNHTVDIIYMVGASLGGLVTGHVIEKLPEVFDGGMAVCGPYGDFQSQLDYFGDFRVVFDYFFADKIEGWSVWKDPGRIDLEFITRWSTLLPGIADAVAANPNETEQLIAVTKAPVDRDNPQSFIETITDVLWYQVFATNDAVNVMGGFMYDNTDRVYTGSLDDTALNAGVERFTGEASAFHYVQTHYETSGVLNIPLVVMHTSLDAIIPAWHMERYQEKATPRNLQFSILVERYGHCNFTAEEVLSAFSELLLMTGQLKLMAEY